MMQGGGRGMIGERVAMKIEIKSRYDSAVLFSVEMSSLKLAIEAAVKARADLRGANLGGANLGDADLGGADLGGANLGGADLGGADLGGAKVRGMATVGVIDGWPTVLWHTDQGYRIQAGCHCFTLDEAKAHYANRDSRRGLYYLATEAWAGIAGVAGGGGGRGAG